MTLRPVSACAPLFFEPAFSNPLLSRRNAARMTQHYARRFGRSDLSSVLIGPQLREARIRAGLKQSEVATMLGVDESLPSRWECPSSTRYKPVPGHHLAQLASILGTTVEHLAPEAVAMQAYAVATATPQAEALPDPPYEPEPTPLFVELADWRSDATVSSTGSVYFTTGGTDAPSQVPGRPSGNWTIRCWQCRKLSAVDPTANMPLCGHCAAPLRARVRVTVTPAAD